MLSSSRLEEKREREGEGVFTNSSGISGISISSLENTVDTVDTVDRYRIWMSLYQSEHSFVWIICPHRAYYVYTVRDANTVPTNIHAVVQH